MREVSATRITYSDEFKVECVRRYLKGESARKIFREAGLEPSLIGNKRIERCISRWKSNKAIMDAASQTELESRDIGETNAAEGQASFDAKAMMESFNIANAAFAAIGTGKSGCKMFDVRDLIIYQQVQQIAILQEKVNELQHQIDSMNKD